ncbi:hypothetical protein FRB90_008998 [Tulasnella sp. 427]|nr:hypothetical protein FRB90_008998 [Tulasnella sp. 427]
MSQSSSTSLLPPPSCEEITASGASPSLFLDHLLTLVASYDSGAPLPPAYPHASSKEAAVEHAIAELAKRLQPQVRVSSLSAYSTGRSEGIGMDWKPHGPPTSDSTPDLSVDHSPSSSASSSCPTCGRAPTAESLARTDPEYMMVNGPAGIPANKELQLLKAQAQDVARVCKAVVNGDLTQKITVPVQGTVMVQLKEVINTMVERLAEFASEVTRVSDEVGTQGKLGGQVSEIALGGTWAELRRTVNKLSANLTDQVRAIAVVTKAIALGDLSRMIEVDAQGEILELKTTVNGMVIRLRKLAEEVSRVSLEVGTLGNLGGQADVPDLEGVWFQLTNDVNKMCFKLTQQVRSIAAVTTAVAQGDLSQRIEIEVEGEMATLKDTVNSMVQQLNRLASEITRVAFEVGTQGVLGGQAQVEGVQGTWADLTNNVNKMAENLTAQVRSTANATKAVAHGDLQQTVQVDV